VRARQPHGRAVAQRPGHFRTEPPVPEQVEQLSPGHRLAPAARSHLAERQPGPAPNVATPSRASCSAAREVNGSSALAAEVDACGLATDNGSGIAAAGWLPLHISVGITYNAQRVIHASHNGEHGTWGSDLLAELTLSGAITDWPPVEHIWAVLVALWSAIAWDEMSGFDANKDARGDLP
jgi:hypothetical protein